MTENKIHYRHVFENYREQENFVGMKGYSTRSRPIGGKIKQNIADFIVREITPSGEILSTYEEVDPQIPYRRGKDHATLFTLVKKKTDTILAAEKLLKFLNVPRDYLKWAGIKDHTAITSQKFSVRGDFIEKLKKYKHRNITITNIRPAHHEIDIGNLWGNHFTINIRSLAKKYESIKPELELWKQDIIERGFPNFYGMQRFGKHRPNSHMIGKNIFLGKYKEACEEFLFSVYPAEYAEVAEFRQDLGETRDYKRAVTQCPKSLSYERMMFFHLADHPDDYRGAINALPPALLNLVLSAFQSYLFNRAISYRLDQEISIYQPTKGDRISILKDPKGHPSLVFYQYQGGTGWNDANILKAFKHDRATIIGPIIGYKTNLDDYPAFKELFTQMLREENFPQDQFKHNDRRLLKFEGTFRSLNNRPQNLEISEAYVTNEYPKVDPHGIKLEFALPKGTYATLLLRELRKPE